MRIFLTGATGYIGGKLARRLIDDGHQLACLVREASQPERVEALQGLGASVHVGELADRESLKPGMDGADWVIHAGAELVRETAMDGANVHGSDNIASLAVELRVPRFLSVSSISYWGGSPADGSPGTEESPVQEFPTAYSASKHAGEQAIRAYCEKGLSVVTVFPSLVYGPPGKRSGANFFLYQLVHGNMPALIAADRKVSWVYVDDVVEAMVRIVDLDLAGGRFILAGEGETLGQTAERITTLTGVKPPRLGLSVPAAKTLLRLAAPFFRLAGKRLPVEPVRLDYLSKHWFFSDELARRDLNWSPRGMDEGLPSTVEMLMQEQDRFRRIR